MIKDVTNSKKDWDDFWYNSKGDYPNWTNNETQRLQNQAVELLDLIEDTSEHFCDEHFVSGEQFYVMMKALIDTKLREFPFDYEQFEKDIYDGE